MQYISAPVDNAFLNKVFQHFLILFNTPTTLIFHELSITWKFCYGKQRCLQLLNSQHYHSKTESKHSYSATYKSHKASGTYCTFLALEHYLT